MSCLDFSMSLTSFVDVVAGYNACLTLAGMIMHSSQGETLKLIKTCMHDGHLIHYIRQSVYSTPIQAQDSLSKIPDAIRHVKYAYPVRFLRLVLPI